MDYKLPERFEQSNKSSYGRVLNIAGSAYMPGAAYLSSISALKVGCGYCFLCSEDSVIRSVAAKSSNVVFVPLLKLKDFIESSDVIEIGCGLSTDNEAQKIFENFLKYVDIQVPVIIDADGINLISKNKSLFTNKGLKNIILTPHPKEAARLLDKPLNFVTENIELAAKEISEIYNCITVLKNHRTFVCSSDGMTYINATGNNSMAKAGSGDVLTGMISGFVAQRMDMFEAACLAVYLHGLCGDLAKNRLTEYSVMAEDLISSIPEAIKYYLKS